MEHFKYRFGIISPIWKFMSDRPIKRNFKFPYWSNYTKSVLKIILLVLWATFVQETILISRYFFVKYHKSQSYAKVSFWIFCTAELKFFRTFFPHIYGTCSALHITNNNFLWKILLMAIFGQKLVFTEDTKISFLINA